MKKIYYLKTCNTCLRILKELQVGDEFELQDIKTQPMTVKQVEEMKDLAGSYEALFSRRAKLYKERDLKNENLTEADYKSFILEHYTFLSRPVILVNNAIFIGNSKKTIEAAKKALNE
ncbi:MAG: hypothetical protein EX254_06080 [Flavobacteriaceae bacterium]|nr:hypothetical protein [Bacteroidia bacterium]NND12133.1 hypothetical protein [Flavobacteriaceae bacterium]NNL62137.1 hypothetical protein [Flavobacteriaceae bacterium]RZV64354.1 MAG: hypothetical protein EX254_06080 [Flavobacteriaceae bacterium]